MNDRLTPEEIKEIQKQVENLPEQDAYEVLELLRKHDKIVEQEASKEHFMNFVLRLYPDFIEGQHHRIMADAFERLERGDIKRLIISVPPRHTKSTLASYLFPAWLMGRDPSRKIIMASHTADLAVSFGRQVKNLIASSDYAEVFPDVALAADAKASGKWATNKNGEYFAVGVGGAIAGRGADFFIIDDAHSEQDAMAAETNPAIFDEVYEWYTSGPRQRLQPGGRICIVMTRWGKRDLVGRVLSAQMDRGGEEWEYIELPALLPSGEPLWPEFWSKEELENLKNELPVKKWMAQYQQTPTSEEGAILKKEYWREWPYPDPPKLKFIIQSWDTAYSAKTQSDFSACTTWGIFMHEDEETGEQLPNAILIDAFKGRLEFPALKAKAIQLYDQFEPDKFVIEEQAAGAPLIFEMRQMGIPVTSYRPVRGKYKGQNDKMGRANAVSDIFSSGYVWAPNRRWAEELITELAEFPYGDHDDYVDSTVQAFLHLRQGGLIGARLDRRDPPKERNPRRRYGYSI